MKYFTGRTTFDEIEQLDENLNVVVICNTTDMPHVPNVAIQSCSMCGRSVWMAQSTVEQIKTNKSEDTTVYLMCTHCYMGSKKARRQVVEMPGDAQLEEVATTVGRPFDEVKKMAYNAVNQINQMAKFEAN